MFFFDISDIEKLEKHLERFSETAFKFAVKDTLNDLAFFTLNDIKSDLKNNFLLKNKRTFAGIKLEKARAEEVKNQKSMVGSLDKYMIKQESGGTTSKFGGFGTILPTAIAAGQKKGKIPRTKAPTSANRITRIKTIKPDKVRGSMTKRKRLYVASLIALRKSKAGLKIRVGEGGGKSAIYQLKGGRQKKGGGNSKLKKLMLYRLKTSTTKILPRNWLSKSVDRALTRADDFYLRAIVKQVNLHGVFKNLL